MHIRIKTFYLNKTKHTSELYLLDIKTEANRKKNKQIEKKSLINKICMCVTVENAELNELKRQHEVNLNERSVCKNILMNDF